MAIQTVGGLQQILKNHDSAKWVKSADLKQGQEFSIADAPKTSGSELSETSKSFGEFLSDSVTSVNELQGVANKAMQQLATGESQNLHETMLMVEKADIAFRSMNQIRMKVIDAYREVMKMQV